MFYNGRNLLHAQLPHHSLQLLCHPTSHYKLFIQSDPPLHPNLSYGFTCSLFSANSFTTSNWWRVKPPVSTSWSMTMSSPSFISPCSSPSYFSSSAPLDASLDPVNSSTGSSSIALWLSLFRRHMLFIFIQQLDCENALTIFRSYQSYNHPQLGCVITHYAHSNTTCGLAPTPNVCWNSSLLQRHNIARWSVKTIHTTAHITALTIHSFVQHNTAEFSESPGIERTSLAMHDQC